MLSLMELDGPETQLLRQKLRFRRISKNHPIVMDLKT